MYIILCLVILYPNLDDLANRLYNTKTCILCSTVHIMCVMAFRTPLQLSHVGRCDMSKMNEVCTVVHFSVVAPYYPSFVKINIGNMEGKDFDVATNPNQTTAT